MAKMTKDEMYSFLIANKEAIPDGIYSALLDFFTLSPKARLKDIDDPFRFCCLLEKSWKKPQGVRYKFAVVHEGFLYVTNGVSLFRCPTILKDGYYSVDTHEELPADAFRSLDGGFLKSMFSEVQVGSSLVSLPEMGVLAGRRVYEFDKYFFDASLIESIHALKYYHNIDKHQLFMIGDNFEAIIMGLLM